MQPLHPATSRVNYQSVGSIQGATSSLLAEGERQLHAHPARSLYHRIVIHPLTGRSLLAMQAISGIAGIVSTAITYKAEAECKCVKQEVSTIAAVVAAVIIGVFSFLQFAYTEKKGAIKDVARDEELVKQFITALDHYHTRVITATPTVLGEDSLGPELRACVAARAAIPATSRSRFPPVEQLAVTLTRELPNGHPRKEELLRMETVAELIPEPRLDEREALRTSSKGGEIVVDVEGDEGERATSLRVSQPSLPLDDENFEKVLGLLQGFENLEAFTGAPVTLAVNNRRIDRQLTLSALPGR